MMMTMMMMTKRRRRRRRRRRGIGMMGERKREQRGQLANIERASEASEIQGFTRNCGR